MQMTCRGGWCEIHAHDARPAGTGQLREVQLQLQLLGQRRRGRIQGRQGGTRTRLGVSKRMLDTPRVGDQSSSIRPVKMRALLAGDEGGGAAATYASVTTTDAETNDPMDQKRQRKACGDTTAIQRVTEQHNGVCQPPRSKRDPPAVSTNAGHTASAAATVPCALTSHSASLHLAIDAWWAHFSPPRRTETGGNCGSSAPGRKRRMLHDKPALICFTYTQTLYILFYILTCAHRACAPGSRRCRPMHRRALPRLGGSSLGPAPCEAVAVAGHSHATPPRSL